MSHRLHLEGKCSSSPFLMAPFNKISSYLNSTASFNPHWQDNTTGPGLQPSHAYYALFYCILIVIIVFGNSLVCLAVLKERSLQTTTNYLVVSLAVADLLVATLVIPWAVYLEVTGGVWNFGRIYCDIFVTMDVMMCTASILNLCAISIDRYTAVVMPVHYQYSTGPSSSRRVSIMIAVVWLLAFAVSCPLLFGFNTTEDPSVCSISNPNFVIYSSVVSGLFYFFPSHGWTLLLLYGPEFPDIKLEAEDGRKARVLTRQGSQRIKACYPQQPLTPTELQQFCSFCHEVSISSTGNRESVDLKLRRKTSCLEVRKLDNGQTATSLRLPSQQHQAVQLRERKATQMLAIVLGTFIVCWLPFFLTHILNTHCQACHISPELYGATTWLGYVNSALNPIIYTTFNSEFRKAFLKILYC
ncbi:D(3) dopamine receptor [Sphaerodactylus townsendi]|uniref:D(3) dopamine receptor n=1 Tax=Sphaerodactylus townsendi TaxID=933632 RepID=UPI0020273F04|nr:D(3) dopamine receptor [Sphaerodactylus townsendi]